MRELGSYTNEEIFTVFYRNSNEAKISRNYKYIGKIKLCGIAGVINYGNIDLEKMMRALKHRGPDDQRLYTENGVALIHTRLAIQDIQNGIQPFHYGNYTIVFNGEIYNHKELRAALKEYTFQTTSDTETLLYLFIKYNERMFEMLDGMFAFAIYDKAKNKIILGRDRAGKKPLYYLKDNDSFIFASELNAIKAVKPISISSEAITNYLRTGFVWRPYSIYEHVFELEAGSYLTLNVDSLNYQEHAYFNILDYYHQTTQKSSFTFQELLDQLESKLKKSIADRITASDVEVGVFLSGGIDSNLIAALASTIRPNIKTFTVKFDGSYDESALAKLTANKYKTNHIELSIHSHLQQDIEKILLSYGEPFMDSSAIPSYYVSREASKHVKVVLGGDGADELFAGYRRYVPTAHNLSKYMKLFNFLLKYMPKSHNKQSLYNYLYRLMAMSDKKGLDFYLSATTDVFEDVLQFENNRITDNLANFISKTFSDKKLSPLKSMLYADFSVLLFCDLLVKMDIASMANSLEVRSPFLSKYLLEFAPTLPDKYKINKVTTKYILRKLAAKYLSPELIKQPKRGFEVPLKKWVNHELKEVITDTLHPGCFAANFVDKKFLQSLLDNHVHVSAEKRAKMLWSLYCLEVWHKNEAQSYFYR